MEKYYRKLKGHLIWVPFIFLLGCNSAAEKMMKATSINAAKTILFYPLVNEHLAILPARVDDKDNILAIDLSTKDTLWKVDVEHPEAIYYNFSAVQYKQQVFVPIGDRIHVWSFSTDEPQEIIIPVNEKVQPHLTISENEVFTAVVESDLNTAWILSYNVIENRWDTVLKHSSSEGRKIMLKPPVALIDEENERYFTLPYTDYAPRDTTFSYFLHWSEGSKLDSFEAYEANALGIGATRVPILWNENAICLAHDQIVVFNIAEGKEIWRLRLPSTMLTSKPFLVEDENLLICALENKSLYAIDLQKQTIKWKSKIAGTPSKCFLKDTTVAVIGGSDGRYYEFDLQNGKKEYVSEPGIIFDRTFYTDDQVTILLSNGQWYIDSDVRSILKRIKE